MAAPRALDLFCGAGGATKGLQNAGFHVTGVDNRPQPRYCGDVFVQADALNPPLDIRQFDFIWASPPCQDFVTLRWMWNAKKRGNLIPATRAMLVKAGVPFSIENVPGAPLNCGLMLCGTMFGLGVEGAELRRHRHFELSWHMPIFGLPCCAHGTHERVIGVYGGHGRDRRRKVNTQDFSTEARRNAMGINWMTGQELSEAIPPAYSEFIGREAMKFCQQRRAA
jgi:DNA (cytosine-5)-methyltransferase 1